MVKFVDGENVNYNPADWEDGSYSSFKWDVNFIGLPVYRAETKQEYYIDYTFAVAKVIGAFFTGGLSAVGPAGITETLKLLEYDRDGPL